MSLPHPISPLLEMLRKWASDDLLQNFDQVRLICHQPQNGRYAYLHRLYERLNENEIGDVEAIVGQPLPPRLREFYATTNGARLFEGQVSISGLVQVFNRDVSRDIPISIEHDNDHFGVFHPDWHNRGYFRLGGVSFLRQDRIICGSDDRIVVLHADTGEQMRAYQDIFECLNSFTREMSQFWEADGTFVGEWDAIDQLLLGVPGSA